jgi:hypothetical protein
VDRHDADTLGAFLDYWRIFGLSELSFLLEMLHESSKGRRAVPLETPCEIHGPKAVCECLLSSWPDRHSGLGSSALEEPCDCPSNRSSIASSVQDAEHRQRLRDFPFAAFQRFALARIDPTKRV